MTFNRLGWNKFTFSFVFILVSSSSFQAALLSCFTEAKQRCWGLWHSCVLLAVLLLLEKGGAGKCFCGVFLFGTGKKEGEALSGFPVFCIPSWHCCFWIGCTVAVCDNSWERSWPCKENELKQDYRMEEKWISTHSYF